MKGEERKVLLAFQLWNCWCWTFLVQVAGSQVLETTGGGNLVGWDGGKIIEGCRRTLILARPFRAGLAVLIADPGRRFACPGLA